MRGLRTIALGAAGIVAVAAAGCSTRVYRPAQTAGFELDPATEITDEDVAKAFAAKPQLPAKVRVAYYVFDDEEAPEIEAMLATVPQVTDSYRIPTLMVTGKRHFDEPRWGAPVSTPPLSIKKLRLLAARAGADLLLIFDYGHRIEYLPNGLMAFGILLVPMLFLPIQDVAVESYLDTYAIDTRNGFLYGQVTASREAGEDFLLIYSNRGEELTDGHRAELVAEAGRLLGELLTRSSVAAEAPAPRPTGPPPSGSAPAPPAIRITVGPGGALHLNGQPVGSDEQVRRRIAELVRAGAAEATIESRAGVPYERVRALLDLLREAKVQSVGIVPAEADGVSSSPEPSEAPPPPSSTIPNPSSGEPTPVTPMPVYPPAGAAEPVTPRLDDRR